MSESDYLLARKSVSVIVQQIRSLGSETLNCATKNFLYRLGVVSPLESFLVQLTHRDSDEPVAVANRENYKGRGDYVETFQKRPKGCRGSWQGAWNFH